ncbi:DUF5677 domain-containing protein (plasmid) [Rhizobium sp. WSM4643]|uniref:DUF5677 domain-containing protein n=1 Tax=Rhizobium sp. WSM4643 TaxID=3138253 RepID=UPI0021A73B83|nr:DUF5677 domain-containing protein [Rhizobium leguminosarum]UWM78906.1 DUF5677 domain-containing protein [Rhizobium leguminosarum bv. viciae]
MDANAVIRDEIAGLFSRYGENTPAATSTLRPLFAYLSSRAQAVTFLLTWGYCWDAEIVLRSFYETAAKILFICLAEEEEKAVLLNEFWNVLGSIGNRRRARKAELVVRGADAEHVASDIFEALTQESIFDQNIAGNKAERKRIEQKWSFSEIVTSLEGRLIAGEPLNGFQGILHMYGMCSHLAHADGAALDLMADRALRPQEELRLLESSHVARIVSDQVSLTWFCAEALRQHFDGVLIDEEKFRNAFEATARASEPIQSAFIESQREFYERIFGK